MGSKDLNLSVTAPSAKAVCSQWLTPLVRSKRERPHRGYRMAALLSLDVSYQKQILSRHARGLLHDGKTHPGLVPVLFRDRAPGVLGFLAGLERALDLGRAFDELVEVHRTELAADHPEIAAGGHDQAPVIQLPERGCPNRAP